MSKKIKLFFLIFFYSIEILRVIFTPITYDEFSFLIKISSQITINYGWLNNLLEIENYAGFGQFFWILYYLYNSIFVIIFNNHQLNFEQYSSVDATSFFQYIDYFSSTHIALIIFRFFCLIPFLVFFWKFVDFIENVQTNSKLNKFYNLLIITLFIVSPIN